MRAAGGVQHIAVRIQRRASCLRHSSAPYSQAFPIWNPSDNFRARASRGAAPSTRVCPCVLSHALRSTTHWSIIRPVKTQSIYLFVFDDTILTIIHCNYFCNCCYYISKYKLMYNIVCFKQKAFTKSQSIYIFFFVYNDTILIVIYCKCS